MTLSAEIGTVSPPPEETQALCERIDAAGVYDLPAQPAAPAARPLLRRLTIPARRS